MNEISELITLRDYVRYAVSQFNEAGLYFGHGTDSAWDEAVGLVLHTLHLPHDCDPAVWDARLTHTERQSIWDLIERRVRERIPLPYLTHEAWFAGLAFYVDERVLIPRSPIAELIAARFKPWCQPKSIRHVLDLCTGSGCIAIATALALPKCQVDASDLSQDALAVAKMNVLRHQVADRVKLIQADLFETLPAKQYDLIISNPPYVDQQDMAELPKEYLHEPSLGLAAGTDGLDCVSRILSKAADYLQPQGVLIVEVGNSEHALLEKYPNLPFIWLEFNHGGGGVFMLTKEELQSAAHESCLADTPQAPDK